MDYNLTKESINNIKFHLMKTTSQDHYNGWNNRTTYGYHSFNINNDIILGQRQPWIRLNKIREHYDFTNKTVLDLGCNTGGMLFHLPELKKAIGLDFNKECIECCNYISSVLNSNTEYLFKEQELNEFDLSLFLNKNNIKEIDVIFLLSLGSWVKNWELLYTGCSTICNTIILETNNDKEGEPQLKLFKSLGFNIKIISENSDDDTTGNIYRKTYIITKDI